MLNFSELSDPVGTLDRLVLEGLASLYEDLAPCDWYVREHEVVNLFTFGHLVPMFQRERLDITQIGIECPVFKVRTDPSRKLGARKDLVIWPHARATCWNGDKPLAVIEWKHISPRMTNPKATRLGHQSDITWLETNFERMDVGYAVLVERSEPALVLTCTRVREHSRTIFLSLPHGIASAAGSSN